MADYSITATGDTGPLPADDLSRAPTISEPDNADLLHLSLVGDSYTVLVSGNQTQGRYCLIDMLVPDGSGPPPHRHDFEEMFTLLEGEVQFTFRGQTVNVPQGATVNIPANAPHQFRNISGRTVHMLCMCTPAGQEEFSARSAIALQAAPLRRRRSARRSRLNEGRRRPNLRLSIERKCSNSISCRGSARLCNFLRVRTRTSPNVVGALSGRVGCPSGIARCANLRTSPRMLCQLEFGTVSAFPAAHLRGKWNSVF